METRVPVSNEHGIYRNYHLCVSCEVGDFLMVVGREEGENDEFC